MAYPTKDNVSREEIKQVVLEKLDLAFWTTIRDYPAIKENAKLDIRQLSYAADEVVLFVRSWILDGHKIDRIEKDTIEFPATPWEFWKQRYAPSWFVNRWPVKTNKTEIRTAIHKHFVCPHVNVRDDNDMHFLWMAKMKEENGKY